MLLYLVRNRPLKVRKSGRMGDDPEIWNWTTTLDVGLTTDNNTNGSVPVEFREAFCRKRNDILASDGSPMTLTVHFIWPCKRSPPKMTVRLEGQILAKLQDIWDHSIKITAEVFYNNVEHIPKPIVRGRGISLPPNSPWLRPNFPQVAHSFDERFKTSAMTIQSASTVDIKEGKLVKKSIAQPQPFVEYNNLQIPIGRGSPFGHYWIDVLSRDEEKLAINMALSVFFEVDDDIITADQDVLTELRSTNGKILAQKLNSDITVVASNDAELAANACFLSVNSSVLAAMCATRPQSGRIELKDLSEQCVKALLEYFYTFKITNARTSLKLAIELFQASRKYDIPALEKHVASILEQRPISWFDGESAFTIFMLTRELEQYEQLNLKAVQVLDSKHEEMWKYEEFQQLIASKDYRTASQLFSALASLY